MAQHKELEFDASFNSSNKEWRQRKLDGLKRKPISTQFLNIPLRFLVLVCVLTVCHQISYTSCQPFLNHLAVYLRSRPPWPTTYPAASQSNNVMQSQTQQQPPFMSPGLPFQMQQPQMQSLSSNVYPTSSEQLQNYIASNNMLQNSLNQGIPVVSMDPAQNSITIMTPTGPEQIIPPSPNNAGGVFVAQPIHPNDNIPLANINFGNVTASNLGANPIVIEQSNGNVNKNNNLQSGPAFMQVLPSRHHHYHHPMGLDVHGQNFIDGNLLPVALSGGGNGGGPPNFPMEQQQSSPYRPGYLLQQNGNPEEAPPPPPPIPKNFKGPAIIAVPKPHPTQRPVLIPSPQFMSPMDNNHHMMGSPSAPAGSQPIIIQSIPQMPSLSSAFSPMTQLQQQPQQFISFPENFILNSLINNMSNLISEPTTTTTTKAPKPVKVKTKVVDSEKSAEFEGSPRTQRKRHHKKQSAEQDSARRDILRIKPTTRPTQIPSSPTETILNEIDNDNTPAHSITDYSLSTIANAPSTTITGSFEYPDPPTPPNFESMNALKYPSPFEDSAEVAVKDPEMTSFREDNRARAVKNSNKRSSKQRRVTTIQTPTGTADSTMHSSISSAAASRDRETSTITAAASTTQEILSEKYQRQSKSGDKSFRPSPQIHSFEEPVTGMKSYITILPPVTTLEDENYEPRGRGKKSLFAKFEASESRHPPYEQGFKPVNEYTYSTGGKSGMPAAATTTETLYFDLIREVVSKAPNTAWSEPDLTAFSEDAARGNARSFSTPVNGLTTSYGKSQSNYGYTTLSSPTTDSFTKAGWKIKDHSTTVGDDGKRQLTTSASSERVENWRYPETNNSIIYFGNGKFGPPNCDKFHRFGFCPMNPGYPTNQVEKIASRCSALLSHLIAPLPKADVRYDVIVAKNGSMLKGRSAAPSGWSWKSFSGKPVCDTKEIKVVPGWAKNEQGDWLVILQTKAWKQEAQITLCTPQGTHYKCKGNKSLSNKKGSDCTPIKIKCVQRFTAQRLAVLDPENTDRCPVLRSVFLPSACVCLHDESSSSSSTSKELGKSAKTGKSSKNKRSKKGSKGKGGSKSSKKSSRSERKSSQSSSSEEDKSDMFDTAADSSTSGDKVSANEKSLGKHRSHHETQVSVPDDEITLVQPHAAPLISKISSAAGEGEEGNSSQNEVEDDNTDNTSAEIGNNSTISPVKADGDSSDRVTTTGKPESSGDDPIADNSSESEEENEDEEKKGQAD